jgi:hypothetical protein
MYRKHRVLMLEVRYVFLGGGVCSDDSSLQLRCKICLCCQQTPTAEKAAADTCLGSKRGPQGSVRVMLLYQMPHLLT